MAHTPGPWEVATALRPGVWVRYGKGIGMAMKRICEVLEVEEGEQKANARLMAAAPKLLEAAKGCLGLLNGDTRKERRSKEMWDVWLVEAGERLQRAIALAEGQK